jgi:hypothetical protein
VIKCNRCGSVNIAGAVRCQSCGNALSSMDTSGSNSKNAMSQEQSALPAWLESLRVGERSRPTTTTTTNNSPQFSTADLIDEGSLPSWMHAQRNGTPNVTGASMPVPLRSSSLPAPSTDGQPFPTPGFAAQSLIDEQSLPSWMQGGEASTPLPPHSGVPAASPPQSGMPTANLVDHGSVPDWMKSLQQQQSGIANPRQPTQIPSTESEVKRVEPVLGPPPSSPGFAARDLVDQQSLPAWMTQLNNQNSTASASREPLEQQSDSFSQPVMNEFQQPIQPGQTGLSARDLIDQQSLPAWMLPQNGQKGAAPSNSGQEKQSNQPATGFPASSLLDMNALPAWLARNEQLQGASSASSQPPTPMASSNRPLPPQQPAMQGPATDPEQGGRIAASSVIDMTALPEWLRSAGGQQSVPQMPPSSSSAPYAGPPRVENVRVPSRPRDAVNASETSEIAATVFASMLGVASTTPNFPAPSGAAYQQQPRQVNSGEQMTLSGTSGIAGMPPSQAGISTLGVANPGRANIVGGQGSQSMAGIPAGSGIYSMPGGPGGQNMAGMHGGSGIHSMTGMPGGPGGQSMAGMHGGSGIHNMTGMPGGPGGQSMAGMYGGSGIHNMTGMPGGPGGQSMAGMYGGSGIHSMTGMPGGPGGQSMAGMHGGSGIHNMTGMPGGPGGQSMAGMHGGSGIHNMTSMPGGPGGQSMAGMHGGSGIHNMTGMPGGPGGQSMAGMHGGSGIHSMTGMPGGPGGQSMAGMHGGSGIHNMTGMPGGPGGQSMAGMHGGSGIHNMTGMPGGPGGQSMAGMHGGPGGQSMAGMHGGPGGQSMAGMPGGFGGQSMTGMPGGQSIAGNAYGNPAQPNAGDNKNAKKRGLFGALLDWLSR